MASYLLYPIANIGWRAAIKRHPFPPPEAARLALDLHADARPHENSLCSGPEQRPEAFLLKMPVVVSTSVSPSRRMVCMDCNR